VSFLEAAGEVAKIGLSLKIYHHKPGLTNLSLSKSVISLRTLRANSVKVFLKD